MSNETRPHQDLNSDSTQYATQPAGCTSSSSSQLFNQSSTQDPYYSNAPGIHHEIHSRFHSHYDSTADILQSLNLTNSIVPPNLCDVRLPDAMQGIEYTYYHQQDLHNFAPNIDDDLVAAASDGFTNSLMRGDNLTATTVDNLINYSNPLLFNQHDIDKTLTQLSVNASPDLYAKTASPRVLTEPCAFNAQLDFNSDSEEESDGGKIRQGSSRPSSRHQEYSRSRTGSHCSTRSYRSDRSGSASSACSDAMYAQQPTTSGNRGRPAKYVIDMSNLTYEQLQLKQKIEEKNVKKLAKMNQDEQNNYIRDRLMNNEAVKNSRKNKNEKLREMLKVCTKIIGSVKLAERSGDISHALQIIQVYEKQLEPGTTIEDKLGELIPPP